MPCSLQKKNSLGNRATAECSTTIAPCDLATIDRECAVFTRYLVGQPHTDYIHKQYEMAVLARDLANDAEFAAFDRRTLNFARRNVFFTRVTDAYCAIFHRHGVLRRKLILLLAILEHAAPTADRFDRPKNPRLYRCRHKSFTSRNEFQFIASCGHFPAVALSSLLAKPNRTHIERQRKVKILVIGSGATGVHFALSALRKNHAVTMIDVGVQKPPTPLPEANFVGLKQHLDDPVRFFLGEDFKAAALPESNNRAEYYNLPAAKDYVFETPKHFRYETYGLHPLVSFATGGLAEAWTGGCYPLNDTELSAFPFGYRDLEPHYGEIARRIGIGGEQDDLAEFFPHHEHLLAAVALDESSAILLARYERRRNAVTAKYKIRMGRSRQAVLATGVERRDGCRYCGRCLWGCPNGALYTPALTLRDCTAHANFSYRPGYFASHFHIVSGSFIDHLVAYPIEGGDRETFRADAYVLACGTLSTSNLFLRSLYKSTGEIIRLTGLTDNRQVLAPFLNLGMLGRSYKPDCYQYHQLAIGMFSEFGQYSSRPDHAPQDSYRASNHPEFAS